MTQNAYLSLIREYKRLAARFNRSYAKQIMQIEEIRRVSILQESNSQKQLDQAIDNLRDMTDREYGRYDREFPAGRFIEPAQ